MDAKQNYKVVGNFLSNRIVKETFIFKKAISLIFSIRPRKILNLKCFLKH